MKESAEGMTIEEREKWDDLEGDKGPPLEDGGGGLGQGSSGGCLLLAGSPRLGRLFRLNSV